MKRLITPGLTGSRDVVRRLEGGKCRKTHSGEKLHAEHDTIWTVPKQKSCIH
jgi:hypothetical protein